MSHRIAARCAVLLALAVSSLLARTASAEPIHYTLELKVDPAKSAEFIDFMKVAAQDTRAFKGCQYFAILVNESDPSSVLFYEIWDSKADHEAYRAWRAETKFGETIGPYLQGQAVPAYYLKADD